MTSRPVAEVFPPGDFVREELEARGWSQTHLAEIIGRPIQTVNMIINGKKAITAETALQLAKALGTSAELWMNLEATYRLARARAAEPDQPREGASSAPSSRRVAASVVKASVRASTAKKR